ncbi:AcrB/AcrD/AcrF family protein [Spirosoma sp. HMF4905]|uniref:AcrB/AcrD/AcrF family protein n=1 Tax=Spirosoma arboris TaxID=2682092 RepID=A0A7K1SHZ6_9BACT|nr:efflux RND transporter permease subunit [Spirosoma arboris]MVM33422.1 AcrB/AcrD/AcrF family protein [Spirosoma arboris]
MFRSYGLLVAFIVLAIVGCLMLPGLSMQLTPSTGGRSLSLSYTWPGAAPEVLEQQVTSRLEGVLATLEGVKKISSVSGYNGSNITLELDRTTDLDATRFEVAALIRQVYPQLPHEVSYPELSLNSPREHERTKPLIILQLSGPDSPGTLQRYANEQIKPLLAAVSDVGNVSVYGGTRSEWLLTYNADVLPVLQLTEADLQRAITKYFQREPLGQLRQTTGRILRVGLDNTEVDANCWRKIPVANRAGRIIYLSDLVSSVRQEPPANQFYRINGKTAINIVMSAARGSNQIRVATALHRQIATLTLPPNYRLDIAYDTTTYIRENLQQIGVQTSVSTMFLLLFVALTTRSRNYITLIISSTVVTLLLSLLVFVWFKVEIHLYSLAALTASLGIVMDNVIVMIDHYQRYRDGKVFTALLGATLTTYVGLAIVWFLPEENRQALTDFALVMAITLSVSFFVSMGFVPVIIERFWGEIRGAGRELKVRNRRIRRVLWMERQYRRLLTGLLRFRGLALTGAVLLFGLPVFWLPVTVETNNSLAPYYNTVLGNNWYVEYLKPMVDKWLGGTLRLFINNVHEGSYQREADRTILYIILELPNQSTPEQMDAIFRRFEKEFSQYGEIDKFITQINSGQEGILTVYFREPYANGIFPYQIKNRAILLSTEMSGVDWDIFGVGQGFSQKLGAEETPTFSIEMFGYNYRQLEVQASVLARQLEKHPRVQSVNTNRSPSLFQQKSLYEFQLRVNPEALALNGIGTTALYNRLADYNARPQPDLYAFMNGDYGAIKLVPAQSCTTDIWMLQHQLIKIGTSNFKLAETSTVVRQKVIPEIHKQDQQYRRIVSFEYLGSYNFGQKFLAKTLEEFRPKLPLGYTVKAMDRYWFGTDESTPYELIGLAVLLIYIICAVVFESLWQPMALIGLIPLSYIGVFLAFYWTDSNFDQGGFTSLILLSGNVVCVGIFVVAEMNHIRNRFLHLSSIRTYQKAFRHKIGPVLMTILSTVIGMIPFLLFGQEPFWYALGVGTIGGLLMSLLAVGIYLPLFLLRKRFE